MASEGALKIPTNEFLQRLCLKKKVILKIILYIEYITPRVEKYLLAWPWYPKLRGEEGDTNPLFFENLLILLIVAYVKI